MGALVVTGDIGMLGTCSRRTCMDLLDLFFWGWTCRKTSEKRIPQVLETIGVHCWWPISTHRKTVVSWDSNETPSLVKERNIRRPRSQLRVLRWELWTRSWIYGAHIAPWHNMSKYVKPVNRLNGDPRWPQPCLGTRLTIATGGAMGARRTGIVAAWQAMT